ncbi:MAG: XrtA system polysaccharide chain length determinant [Steroidobacteraceae bacterium]|jgi:polysaccharide chain length determinant protein (PEP-CTERM system associated)
MTPATEQFFDNVRGSWRFRWYGLALAAGLALLGWIVVLSLSDRYEANAQVFVDTRTALKPALQGLTVDQNVDAQINYVRQSLLEGPQLEQIARDTGVLPADITDERERVRILDQLKKRIVLDVVTAGSQGDERATAGTVYTINYLDNDRSRSLRVVEKVLNTFVERVLGGKREGSQSAQKFLEAQVKEYEHRLSVAEDRLAAFKKKNIGLMPNEQGGYFAQLQTEVDAAKKAETDLAIAISRRDELSKQLHSDAAISAAGASNPIVGAAGLTNGGDTLSRIQEAQARLDDLLLKYTDKHPDVIAARATLEELKKRRQLEMDSLRRGDANAVAASGAGNNPVYQSIQLELNKEDVEIAALRRQLTQHQEIVAELRQNLNSAPQVEAEFQQLNRDYDVNKAEYSALLANYQKAKLGEQADNAGSVRFEVAVPPTSPILPVWPKRGQLLVEVWLAAIAIGAGVAYWWHTLHPVVTSARAVSALTNFPLLGVVGGAFPSRARIENRRHILRISAAAACLILALVAVLVLNQAGVRLNFLAGTSPVKS